MTTHDPIQVIQQLQSILSNPSKKIGFLLGAGVSLEDKNNKSLISGSKIMTRDVIGKFTKNPQKRAIELIKSEIDLDSKKFNIETLLSKISEKERAVGSEKLCGLTKAELEELRKEIEKEIKKLVSVHANSVNFNIEETNHHTFSKWISNADKEFPIEIFTTNYDYLLELALEKQQIPYFDGFAGSCNAFFCPEWIEDDTPVKDWIKLWKLHGSLGWGRNKENEIIRTSEATDTAIIYPSFLKYDHSKKQPYLSYMDRLSYFLKQKDSVLFVCGYSFEDEHVNEIILTSLNRAQSSSVFVFNFEELKEADSLFKNIAETNSKVSIYAQRTCAVGCKLKEWKISTKEDSSVFFKEDKLKTADDWDGKGSLLLGDFKTFTEFLSGFYKKL